jgi:hypothetical protein
MMDHVYVRRIGFCPYRFRPSPSAINALDIRNFEGNAYKVPPIKVLAHRGRSHSEILPRAEGNQPTHWRVIETHR